MAETKMMTAEQVVAYLLEGEGLDFLRESLTWVCQQLMEAEVSELVAYVAGVSTRKVDQVVESLGLRISRSEVSRICQGLDEQGRRQQVTPEPKPSSLGRCRRRFLCAGRTGSPRAADGRAGACGPDSGRVVPSSARAARRAPTARPR
jgi:hypothetical protein